MVLSLLHGVNRFSFGQSAVAAKRAPDAVHQSGPMLTCVTYKIITKKWTVDYFKNIFMETTPETAYTAIVSGQNLRRSRQRLRPRGIIPLPDPEAPLRVSGICPAFQQNSMERNWLLRSLQKCVFVLTQEKPKPANRSPPNNTTTRQALRCRKFSPLSQVMTRGNPVIFLDFF